MIEREVTIPVEGIQLEGVLGGEEGRGTAPGVLICHPHPEFGGSMENNVVSALFETFSRGGFWALKFNFRGVGRSGGRHGGGEQEVLDVIAALNLLGGLRETEDAPIGLVGYSFGAWVGLRGALGHPRVRCLGAVAPPLAMYTFDFLAEADLPVAVVAGDRDPFCPVERGGGDLDEGKGERRWRILHGADHFFLGREVEAARFVWEAFQAWLTG